MTSVLTARVDAGKRASAERVFSEVGLSTSAAVNLFICTVAMTGGIPFMITARPETTNGEKDCRSAKPKVKIGIADGKYTFKPDFDKTFDDMDAEVAELFS